MRRTASRSGGVSHSQVSLGRSPPSKTSWPTCQEIVPTQGVCLRLAALGLRVMPRADVWCTPGALAALTSIVHGRKDTDDYEHQRAQDEEGGDLHTQAKRS